MCVPSELGAWEDDADNCNAGWEEELATDECHIIQDSRFAMKEKRKYERQCKNQAQKYTREHKKNIHPCLGVKNAS